MMAAAARKSLEVPKSTKGKATADEWTNATEPTAPERAEAIKKLSLEFPADVHRATKAGAALLDVTMIGAIVQMCRARFMNKPWPADVVEQVRKQIEAEQQAEPEPAAPAARARRTPARKRSAS